MKLLIENWRGYLNEDKAPGEAQIKAVLEKMGLIYSQWLGSGYFGAVIEVEDSETGERNAAKIVADQPAEERIYSYVMNNRNKFGEYAKYLPEVYSIDRVDIGDGKRYAVIQMELLQPAPEALKRVFASADPPEDTDYSVRDRTLFKNPKFVVRLIRETAEDLERSLGTIYDYRKLELWVKEATRRIATKFFSVGIKMSMQPTSPQNALIINNSDASYLKSKESMTLINLILEDFEDVFLNAKDRLKMLQAGNRPFYQKNPATLDNFIKNRMESAASVFYESYQLEFVPTYPVSNKWRPDAEESEDLPEVESITNALMKLGELGLIPGDIHSGNIMIRPTGKDIVFVDLGLFKIGKAKKAIAKKVKTR